MKRVHGQEPVLATFLRLGCCKTIPVRIRKYSLNSSCKPATINVAIPTLQQYLMEASRTGMPLVSYNDHGRLSMLYSKSRSAIRDFSAFFVRAFVR